MASFPARCFHNKTFVNVGSDNTRCSCEILSEAPAQESILPSLLKLLEQGYEASSSSSPQPVRHERFPVPVLTVLVAILQTVLLTRVRTRLYGS